MAQLQRSHAELSQLLASASSHRTDVFTGEIAEWNLLCAAGLPGSQSLDIDAALVRIDEMAHHVNAEIHRNYHRFLDNPAESDFCRRSTVS
jgi:hypothetical protein